MPPLALINTPTLLQKVLAALFEGSVRARGMRYYTQARVNLRSIHANGISASVSGSLSRPYKVSLRWNAEGEKRRGLQMKCDCPYYESGDFCKHIWATLLQIDTLEKKIVPASVLEDTMDEREEQWGDEGLEDLAGETQGDPEFLPPRPLKKLPQWKDRIGKIAETFRMTHRQQTIQGNPAMQRTQEVWYLLDTEETCSRGRLALKFYQRALNDSGKLGKLKALGIGEEDLPLLTDPLARKNLALMLAGSDDSRYNHSYHSPFPGPKQYGCVVAPAHYDIVLPGLFASGKVGRFLENHPHEKNLRSLHWDASGVWKFQLQIVKDESRRSWKIWGNLHCGERRMDLSDAVLLLKEGLVIGDSFMGRFEDEGLFAWVGELRERGPLLVPWERQEALALSLYAIPHFDAELLPATLRLPEKKVDPLPRLSFDKESTSYGVSTRPLGIRVYFDYGGQEVSLKTIGTYFADPKSKVIHVRDCAKEQGWLQRFEDAGLLVPPRHVHGDWDYVLHPANLQAVVLGLLELGCEIKINKQKVRKAHSVSLAIASGMDWFDLSGEVDFGGVSAPIPKLLSTLSSGHQFFRLPDGSQGVLPQDLRKELSSLVNLGKVQEDGRLQFRRSQAILLDGLLATQSQVDRDATYLDVLERMRSFKGVQPANQPAEFKGQLRGYQKEGLGWFHFLEHFNLGGCLADDMGLGKTIQVLALLQERKRTQGRCSLVVAPKSLLYNWIDEASRFAPELRGFNLTGLDRSEFWSKKDPFDLVVTSYGTLTRDIEMLKDLAFDYVILDEAQVVKNSATQAFKAARLLRADHRLALSGTPIENHLGDLWSLFEFLNPGILGASEKFSKRTLGKNPSPETVELLARGLAPFILRRTKQQVLPELPRRTEQTLYGEMEKDQKVLYAELRDHYRTTLSQRIAVKGLARSKIHILEALLRLRQAACHPGLLDAGRRGEPSAKLQILLEQLRKLREEGHKVLVFSQFTSMLSIVRDRLQAEKWDYEYLDGKTPDRKARVTRFQTDPECRLFLISLKAGGLGLNLTAADYVFILDPWWNPAVEAQAIDRTHRIGQTRNVFAYRLITKGTIEEKILELQARKKGLAEAIISERNSLIGNLTWEDLQLLLA